MTWVRELFLNWVCGVYSVPPRLLGRVVPGDIYMAGNRRRGRTFQVNADGMTAIKLN